MSAVKSFLLAIDLATRKRDEVAQGLMRVQSAHLFAQDQMSQLEIYAAETASRWTAAAQVGTTPELLRHHYQFLDRLQQAIGLQQGVLAHESRKVAQAKQLVLQAEFRLASLKQVLKKKQAGLALIQTRREQKQMDEFAALQTRRTSAGHFSGDHV
ncbi:MAG: flagellar export protein FliJ [Rhodoferax sp.]|uniref:flagellar export protein FliJ n=1 Tax=Rhodoferax sp. TaxID=50421 RepID=UPI0013FE5644|nr:flagellar export protein FliJ [Rhodoferax sp.]NDP39195.1 flagellar export protein FliJ [Rhodoferax sp.]